MAETGSFSKPAAKSLFAVFGVRMAAIMLDFIAAMFLSQVVRDYVFEPIGLSVADSRLLFIAVLFVYFTVFWSSPLRATPLQFLFGMRVVDETGERLSPDRAALRSAMLVGLIIATFALIKAPANPYLVAAGLVAIALLFLAAVMPNRQALHDRLAHSLVVNRTALKSQERRGQLRQHVADHDAGSRKQRQPSLLSIAGNLLVLGIPVFVLMNAAAIQNDRDLNYRTGYAVEQVQSLKIAVEDYHAAYARWPSQKSSELGAGTRADYPDGGYYELENDGAIRIRFTVKPQLVKGSIVLRPIAREEGVTWECYSDGNIARNHLPAMCRDRN